MGCTVIVEPNRSNALQAFLHSMGAEDMEAHHTKYNTHTHTHKIYHWSNTHVII